MVEVNGITAAEMEGFDENAESIKANLIYIKDQTGHKLGKNQTISDVIISLLINKISVKDIHGHRWSFCENFLLEDKNVIRNDEPKFKLRKRGC